MSETLNSTYSLNVALLMSSSQIFVFLCDSYLVTSQVLRFGHLSKAETLFDTVLRFFASVDKEVILPHILTNIN